MLRRLFDWMASRCDHKLPDGSDSWEPYFYGKVYHDEDLFVVIDFCPLCGATIARTP